MDRRSAAELGNPLVPAQTAPTTDGPWAFPATPHTAEQRAAWEAQRVARANESKQQKQDRERLEKEAAEARGYDKAWELPAPEPTDLAELVKELSGDGLEEVTSLINDDQPWEDKLVLFQKWSQESHAEFEALMSPARDPGDIPERERALSRFPEDGEEAKDGIRAKSKLDMSKGMLTHDQVRDIGKKVKKWMEWVVETQQYTRENMHRLGRELFEYMHETTGKREFPRHEQWDNLLWDEAKKLGLNTDQRNKIMRMTGKKWKKRMLATAATVKIIAANEAREREI